MKRNSTGLHRNAGAETRIILDWLFFYFLFPVLHEARERKRDEQGPPASNVMVVLPFSSRFWFRPNLPLRLDGRNAAGSIGLQRAVAIVASTT